MERVYHHISILRNKLFCSSSAVVSTSTTSSSTSSSDVSRRCRRTKKIVRRMDPMVRTALVHTMQNEMIMTNDDDYENDNVVNHNNHNNNNNSDSAQEDIATKLHEIEQELQLVQQQLHIAIEKEQFISQRSHTYHKLLDEQAYRIKQQQQQLQLQQSQQTPTTTTTLSNTDHTNVNDDISMNDIERGAKENNDDNDMNELTVKNPLVMTDTADISTTMVQMGNDELPKSNLPTDNHHHNEIVVTPTTLQQQQQQQQHE